MWLVLGDALWTHPCDNQQVVERTARPRHGLTAVRHLRKLAPVIQEYHGLLSARWSETAIRLSSGGLWPPIRTHPFRGRAHGGFTAHSRSFERTDDP